MFKNVTGQKWSIIAWNSVTGERVTGDAANITAKINLDDGGMISTDDTNPTELGGDAPGHYVFNLLQEYTNADKIELMPRSTTANVQCIATPSVVYTRPPNFGDLGIESDGDLTQVNTCTELTGHQGQTGDSYARIGANGSGLSDLATAASITSLNDVSAAEVNTQVDAAIVTYGLDHLVSTSVAGADIADNSVIAKMASKAATADWDTFVNTTDSLEAVADAESSPPTAAAIRAEIDSNSTQLSLIVEDTATTLPGLITAVDDFVDTEVAAIKVVTDKLDDTLVDNSGTYRFTTESLSLAHSASVTISQQPIPDSRTWKLRRGSTGALVSGGSIKGIQVGEDVLFAISFEDDLSEGSWVESVSSVAIQTGTGSGVTFGTPATNGPFAKVKIAGVTAGSYTIRCKATYADSLEEVEGDVTMKVVAA